MNGMSIERDGRECRVIGSDGRILAVFDAGSLTTNLRHANEWIAGTFDRNAYEDDIAADVGWTGQHVLAGLKK